MARGHAAGSMAHRRPPVIMMRRDIIATRTAPRKQRATAHGRGSVRGGAAPPRTTGERKMMSTTTERFALGVAFVAVLGLGSSVALAQATGAPTSGAPPKPATLG